ncbi:adenylate/guanylate cyclase domain-containing protein [Micromonospora sp. R77]|uniref:adenylate/guanylate cyclase domain-containing protein n=1 Tax=Micromonospora sp. R77 TaxID=2925836 RepID=UPI001F620943|nr:adenylate/guanylate cyclase domain-containing protein [Micromonospora sp. R77]MCI4065804.1 adenylate/guanylate cyclase domain-containing protein [Micromonospora sp. R77]
MSTIVTGAGAATSAHWPVPEERRTVTVLFADIVGSTGLVERLDPEDVRTLQYAYFGAVAGVLRRWHGVVEKYIGDAVVALFGAGGSDGFDAYRAVRAGLEIQQAVDRRMPAGTRLRVRVGVATGEALVDVAGIRDGGHGAASGAVLTTAARLRSAPPGAVVVCPTTRRATAGLVEQRPLATMTLTGKAQPLDVWRVTGPARPRPPGTTARWSAGVGALHRRRRDRPGRPRPSAPLGVAGRATGSHRSRLLHELARAVPTVEGTEVRWCVTHCPPYPQGRLAPLADMVRGFAGIRDTDPAATVRRRLVARSTAGPDDAGGGGAGAGRPARRPGRRHRRAPRRRGVAACCWNWPPPGRWWWRWTTWTGRHPRTGSCTVSSRRRPATVAARGRRHPRTGLGGPAAHAADRCRRVSRPRLRAVDPGGCCDTCWTGPAARPRWPGRCCRWSPGTPAWRRRTSPRATGGPPDGPGDVRRVVDARLDRLDECRGRC